jgi:hypothetical protein
MGEVDDIVVGLRWERWWDAVVILVFDLEREDMMRDVSSTVVRGMLC